MGLRAHCRESGPWLRTSQSTSITWEDAIKAENRHKKHWCGPEQDSRKNLHASCQARYQCKTEAAHCPLGSLRVSKLVHNWRIRATPVCCSPVFSSPAQCSVLGYYYYLSNPFKSSKSRCFRPYSLAETTIKKKTTHKVKKKNTRPAVYFCITRLGGVWLWFYVHPALEERQTDFKRHGSL